MISCAGSCARKAAPWASPSSASLRSASPTIQCRASRALLAPAARARRRGRRLARRAALVCASFGTVNHRLHTLYQAVLDAFRGAALQLFIPAGGGFGLQSLRAPEGALVLDRAPQRCLLTLATAFITHAGVNSSLAALQATVPMVAIP